MESVNHNCNSQIPRENVNTPPLKKENPIKKELPPFHHRTFFYSVFAFSVFYVFLWIIEDKSDLAKTSTLFTYANSIVNILTFILYYFTENVNYLIYGTASFIVSLLAELYYGHRHFPDYMNILSTYLHHFTFLTLMSISFWRDCLQYTCLVMIVEVPTFFLNHKRRYSVKSPWINWLFGITFFLSRILFWPWFFFTHPFIANIKLANITSLLVYVVFIYWFVLWLKKHWK